MLDKKAREELFGKDVLRPSIVFSLLVGSITVCGVVLTRAIFYTPRYNPPAAQVSGEQGVRSVVLGPIPKDVETAGYQGAVNLEEGNKVLQVLANDPKTVLTLQQAGQAAFAYDQYHRGLMNDSSSKTMAITFASGGIVGGAAGLLLFGACAAEQIQATRRRREQQAAMARVVEMGR